MYYFKYICLVGDVYRNLDSRYTYNDILFVKLRF